MEYQSQNSDKQQYKIEQVRENQDVISGLLGGIHAALLGAVLWAVITVMTEYQVGYMAVGVGLLVGFAVRYFGRGIEQVFGIIGAVLAFLGCLGGNILSTVGFISQTESLSYFQVLAHLNVSLIIELLQETFQGIDILFYIIAIYEGYRFSFYQISTEGLPNALYIMAQQERAGTKMRATLLAGLMIIVVGITVLIQSASDTITHTYPSGAKLSEGKLVGGELDGQWTFWHENGQMQSLQSYVKGVEDGVWQWWDEHGTFIKEGHYKSGLPHGRWTFYYQNGQPSQEGDFAFARKDGRWVSWYENGGKSLECFYKRDLLEGAWTAWYENGKKREEGQYQTDEKIGRWMSWYEDGTQEAEIEFTDGASRIVNRWDTDGTSQIADGHGTYVTWYENGQTQSSVQIEGGRHIGTWSKWYDNGQLMEEGTYVNDKYRLDNFWTNDGEQLIQDGNGKYLVLYENKTKALEGAYNNGVAEGEWKYLFPTGEPLRVIAYKQGIEDGDVKGWYENGSLHYEGTMMNGKPEGEWTWWYDNGLLQSKATFINGRKEGTQSFWSESEKLAKEELYKDGEFVSEKLLLLP